MRAIVSWLVAGVVVVVGAAAAAPPAAASAGPRPPAGGPASLLAGMSLEQRVGQLFMVGGPATGVGQTTRDAVTARHVGNVMLTGRSSAGVAATARVSSGLQHLATQATTGGVPLMVATDQEGGAVQVLSGPGFSDIPSALVQGRDSTTDLRARATRWGQQLRAAGVTVDLAPVMDTVPSPQAAEDNPPIGVYDRQYGYTPAAVASHGTAFAAGMARARVAATAKHFPGLGRVGANTDTTAHVVDGTTTRQDPYVRPFAVAVDSGVPFLMVSSAVYARIDPNAIAAFSPTVMIGMARNDLGFQGVIISDSFSATALSPFPVRDRGVRFLSAGGDMVLVSVPSLLAPMYDGVLARARSDAAFRDVVDAAALRVLQAKEKVGLVPSPRPLTDLYYLSSTVSSGADRSFRFGRATDGTVVGTWDRGSGDRVGVHRGNTFYLVAPGGRSSAHVVRLGRPGDEPLVGDWDGDGDDTLAVRRGTMVYVTNQLGGPVVAAFSIGRPGDELVVGDWDGDGDDTLAVHRGRQVLVTQRLGGPVTASSSLGRPGDVALAGDWDGDGADTLALRRGNVFFVVDRLGDPSPRAVPMGRAGDLPLTGDWDADGDDELGGRR